MRRHLLALVLCACRPAITPALLHPESFPPGPLGHFRVGEERFAAWDGADYREFFVRAINFGACFPGDGPSDLSADEEDYARWLAFAAGMGFNAVRLYVLHPPEFYAALARYNREHADAPVYLIQGVYLPELSEDGDGSGDLYEHVQSFETLLARSIDAVHGQAEVSDEVRGAHGSYVVDASQWTLAWLIGREVVTKEVRTTDARHPELRGFDGVYLRMPEATASERFMAERLDFTLATEMARYGVSRPIAWSNWLELDPLEHPSEGRDSGSDIAQVDFAKLDASAAPAGHFVSYHAYPYFPNFVSEDPGYRMQSDELGPNSYLGLVRDLRAHHAKQALFIAEFGVPSSWGRAHESFSGMHHGGLTEEEQGNAGARMMRNIASVGAAGFSYFQLTDGWWKRIWITNARTFPSERLRLWHDMLNAQQHYGLIAFELPGPDWDAAPEARGSGRVRSVRAAFDAEFARLRLALEPPLSDGETLIVGLDTYSDDRGERQLPGGVSSARANEFVLIVTPPSTAELRVMRTYDAKRLGRQGEITPAEVRSTASDSGEWLPMQWRTAAAHGSDDGRFVFADVDFAIGKLGVRRAPGFGTTNDAVIITDAAIELRLPWNLLNFSDPSRAMVIDDDPSTEVHETAQSTGIAASIVIDDNLLETERFTWRGWESAPKTRERVKASAPAIADALGSLR